MRKDFIRGMFLILVIVGSFFFLVNVFNTLDHSNYLTINKDEITLIKAGDSPVFVPKGAFIIGELHQYIDVDGKGQPENPKVIPQGMTKKEYLVKSNDVAVIYWHDYQKTDAEILLNK